MDALEQYASKNCIRHIRVDGKVVQPSRREQLVEDFQTGDARLALMAITAAGQGISLTAARVVVFAELHWVPGKLLQAEDRVHRMGQEHDVDIHYCVVEGKLFMDETMINLLEIKERVLDEVVDGAILPTRFGELRR